MSMLEEPTSLKIAHLTKSFKQMISKECSSAGINATYSSIIRVLSCNKNGLSQNEIVNSTRLAAPTISLTLKAMENIGYVKREPSKDDCRKTVVLLTSEGELINQVIRSCFKKVESMMIKGIAKEDLDSFCKILDLMSSNLLIEEDKDNV